MPIDDALAQLEVDPTHIVTTTSKEFSLEDKLDLWRINGVQYRNGIYTVDLKKELLEDKKQDQHTEAAVEAKKNAQFHFPSYPLLHSLVSTLEQNKNNPIYKKGIEEARLFIKNSTLKNWLITSTRIIYNPTNEKDIVIHDYKQPDQYSLELDTFIGPDCFITSKEAVNVESPLKCLLNTGQSAQEINSIYKWLTDLDAYLYRVNTDRQVKDERVAGFWAASSRAILYCNRYHVSPNSSLGVRYAPQAHAAK